MYIYSFIALKSRGFAISRDKLKTIYLHYHNANVYQTWQSGDLPRVTFTYLSHDPLNACSGGGTWQVKIIKPLISQFLSVAPSLSGW